MERAWEQELEHDKLMVYLASINSLEVALLTLKEGKRRFEAKRRSLYNINHIELDIPCRWTLFDRIGAFFSDGGGHALGVLLGFAVGAVIPSVVLGFIACLLSFDIYKILPLPEDSFGALWAASFFFYAITMFFVLLYFIYKVVRTATEVTVKASRNNRKRRENKASNKRARKSEAEESARNRQVIANVLNPQIAAFDRKIEQLGNKVQRLYDMCHLAPEYRNFEATVNIFRYLRSGMCTQLGGMGGAYYMYEFERNAGRIVKAINDTGALIISRLNTVISNQYSILHNQERQMGKMEDLEDIMKHVDTGLSMVSSQMSDANATLTQILETDRDTNAAVNSYIRSAQPALEDIRRGVNRTDYNTSVTALNSYISMREREGSSFDLFAA